MSKTKELTLSQLKEIYNNNTLSEASKILGVSVQTFCSLLQEYKIPRKNAGRPKKIKIIED